jgi:hypothetical protein
MNGPVVVIGFILLIPSILGMLASALVLFGVFSIGGAESTRAKGEAVIAMRHARFPETLINAIVDGRDADVDAWLSENGQHLSGEQVEWVREAQRGVHSHLTGSALALFLGSGFSVWFGIVSFVGGLLGWLLVMKKRVLQCSVCGAVVNAS